MDERLFEARPIEPVSIGDYVLSGGEVAALVTLDACVRLLPGVMGATSSGEEESFEAGLLEYPQYTRPRSEEHTSELQSLMRISYAVFCLQKKNSFLTYQTNIYS